MLPEVAAALLGCLPVTKNPVFHLFHSPGNVGPLILRLVLAGIFFYHGSQKAFGWFGGLGWQGTIESWNASFGLPVVLGSSVILLELTVCLLLFVGFLTRLAGLGVVVIMTGALLVLGQSTMVFSDLELPLLVWSVGLAILCLGGGALSVDRGISRNLLPIVG